MTKINEIIDVLKFQQTTIDGIYNDLSFAMKELELLKEADSKYYDEKLQKLRPIVMEFKDFIKVHQDTQLIMFDKISEYL